MTRAAPLRTPVDDIAHLLSLFPLPEYDGKTIFLTGATGFIGFWLLQAFAAMHRHGQRFSVCALSRQPQAHLVQRPEFRRLSWLRWHTGDIKDYAWPREAFDFMIHAATDTSPAAAARPQILHDDIVLGSERLAEHALAEGARRILFLSSGAVYGEPPSELALLPEEFPGNVSDTIGYAPGKRKMEALAAALSASTPVHTVIARGFAFAGYRLPAHLALSSFIQAALYEPAIILQGDGRATRSFLYAADMAVWLLALLARGKNGTAYNVGSPDACNLHEIALLVRDNLAPGKPVIVLGREDNASRRRYVPDIQRITKELGVAIWTPLPEAIRRMAMMTLPATASGT